MNQFKSSASAATPKQQRSIFYDHVKDALTSAVFCSEKEEENDEVEDMEVENSMECKLSLNSYKIRFVKGSEDYLYRRQALKRAKEVRANLSM